MNEEENYQLVSIEEMRELILQERDEILPRYDLWKDEATGLYSTDLFAFGGNGVLRDHYTMERIVEKQDEVDWLRITNCYDAGTIGEMLYTHKHPLVWLERTPNDLPYKYIVTGKVAVEQFLEDRLWYSLPIYKESVLNWFVKELPTPSYPLFYDPPFGVPDDMILWNYLLNNRSEEIKFYQNRRAFLHEHTKDNFHDAPEESENLYLDIDIFFNNLQYVVKHFGAAKAAEIVRLLQSDWKSIVALKLFGVNDVSKERIEEFRTFLFEGLERYLVKWESEDISASNQRLKNACFPLISEQCRKEKKVASVEAEIRAACRGTAVGLWKILRTNAALNYIEPLEPWNAADLYRTLTDYFGVLPFKERNFREARNKK